MARALKSGARRMLGRHDGPPGRSFDSHYRGLAGRFGPFDPVARDYASSVAALFVEWQSAAEILAGAQRQRKEGRGRRPSTASLARLQKRAGLAWTSYDASLRRLEELAAAHGHGDFAARLLAVPPAVPGRTP